MMHKNKAIQCHNKKLGQSIFEIGLLIVAVALFVLPFINLLSLSLSSSRAILSGEVYFWPVEMQLDLWIEVFKNNQLVSSFFFTIFLTIIYTLIGLILIMMAAYPLSRKNLKGRVPILGFFMLTMYFSGGLIPTYLLLNGMNLIDNFLVLILPGVFSVFNMLVLKSFYQGIPDSIEESAKIDGANDFQILFRIYLPLSLPAMAVLALFFAVGRWNSFSDAIFFLPTRHDMAPLQLTLQRMLTITFDKVKQMEKYDGVITAVNIVRESQKAASILFTIVPILLVYPWLQRYFVKGVVIGSVKA